MKLLRFIVLSYCLFIVPFSTHAQSAQDTYTVNINTANAEVLSERLSGVGLKKAEAIVAYRNQYGEFKSLEQIIEVKGIGESIVEKNRSVILLQ